MMRDEKRRRTRDEDFPPSKKKRDDSPNAHYSTSSGTSSTKSRGHMPVSERQQFALLKLLETKNPSTERSSKQAWDGQEHETGEPRSNIMLSSLPKQQSSGLNSSLPP
ncbi:unnamed protein product, partial [Rodentolepis nana]|uniref:Uncharacterized protein n=1 Tax=Rodentolepis nana TaxID=102285 RepID=A0A0R3TFA8_RODNA